MKRRMRLFLILSLLCLVVGYGLVKSRGDGHPPRRIGAGTMHTSLSQRYTVETAFAAADVVARIQVGNWLEEDTELHQTYYGATVLECFKGDIPKAFTLLQSGCSTFTVEGYPLFTKGNELLLFLREAEGLDFEAPYWIIGSFTTVMDVAYDTAGNRYYADRYGIFCEEFYDCVNYTSHSTIASEVRAYAAKVDSIVKTMGYAYPKIYLGNDFERFMEGL